MTESVFILDNGAYTAKLGFSTSSDAKYLKKLKSLFNLIFINLI